MNKQDEIHKIFEEFATPRVAFVESLKKQVVSYGHGTSPRSNFISNLFMKLSKPTVRIAAMATLLVVSAGAATYSYWYKPQPFANQEEILAKIAQANEGVKRDAATTNAATGEADQKISALYIRPAEDRNYNYRKYTNTYEIGAAAAKCTQMVPYQSSVTKDELYEYFSDKDEMFPKYTKTTAYAGSDLYDYNLTVGTDRWQYRGGSYVVHLTNVQQMMTLAQGIPENVKSTEADALPELDAETAKDLLIATPTETPTKVTNPEDVIKNYFGEDAKILGKKTVDGREVYEVKWSFSSTCGDLQSNPDRTISSSSVELDETITVVALADAKDFAIVSESYYLGASANRNLLYTHGMVEEKKNIASFADIRDEFTFSLNVPGKTVDAAAYQYDKEYRKAVLDYANKNMSTIAYLAGKFKLQSLSSPYVSIVPDHEKHLIDRAFYSTKPYGQALYDENKDMFKPYQEVGKTYPTVQLTYDTNGPTTWASLALVQSSLTGKDAVATLGVDAASVKDAGTVAITINGEAVKATVYEVMQNNSTEPGSVGASDSEITTLPADEGKMSEYRDLYVVFTTPEFTGVLQTNVKRTTTMTDFGKLLVVKTMSTADVTALDKALPVPVVTGRPDLIAY